MHNSIVVLDLQHQKMPHSVSIALASLYPVLYVFATCYNARLLGNLESL